MALSPFTEKGLVCVCGLSTFLQSQHHRIYHLGPYRPVLSPAASLRKHYFRDVSSLLTFAELLI